jgi:UDP-N-acetylglucosamine 2-epimerase (non-hydrolysing)
LKVLVCFGTRPEAIKMAPVIHSLQNNKIEHRICVTAQHREMLDQVLEFFNIQPDYDLNLMKPDQNLNLLSSAIFRDFDKILKNESPDLVLVQGDTTSAFTIAMTTYNSGIKVGHIEAGLRTYNLNSPFPEEANRQLISRIANLHFTPTTQATLNLLKEMIDNKTVFQTGNTIVDALIMGRKRLESGYRNLEIDQLKNQLIPGKKIILVTGHRRENFNKGLNEICQGLREIAKREDVQIVFPVHPNPKVQEIVFAQLGSLKNIHLSEPLNYPAMLWMLDHCEFIISDSGGIQEEAPSFEKLVLVTRSNTERMEGVDSGFCILTGTSKEKIITESYKILDQHIKFSLPTANPFGDGKASDRIVEVLRKNS